MTDMVSSSPRHPRAYWLVLSCLLMILVTPLSLDTLPPLLDYSIHLARSYIYVEYENNPILRAMFNVDWRPIPNLGSDIALLFLTKFFSIEVCGRVLLAMIVIFTVFGVVVLHRINFHQWSWWPVIVVLPAYHGALTAGFLNYSIGLSLIPFFLSVHVLSRESGLFLNALANSLAAIILYFCHVISVGVFGIVLFGFVCWQCKASLHLTNRIVVISKQFLSIVIPFILPAIFYLRFSFLEVVARSDPMLVGEWSLLHKIRGVFMVILSGNYYIDAITLVFISGVIIWMVGCRKCEFQKGLIFGCALIALLFLILPSHLLEAAFIMDRLPVACVLIAISAMNPKGFEGRQVVLITGGIVILTALRAWSMSLAWSESDIYYQRLSRILTNVEPGSSVIIVSPFTKLEGKSLKFWHDVRMAAPNWHFALLNIPTLHAMAAVPLTKRSAFSQVHFVWADKQVLSLSDEFVHLDYGDGGASTWQPKEIFVSNEESGCRANYDDRLNVEQSTQFEVSREVVANVGWCGFDQDIVIADVARKFDYILVVYANYLQAGFRQEIERQFSSYSDKDIVLVQVPSPDSWRMKHLELIEQSAFP